jgi:hypothetical protein
MGGPSDGEQSVRTVCVCCTVQMWQGQTLGACAGIALTSLHFTSLHFTSLHFTSLHFTSLHFTSLHTFTNIHTKPVLPNSVLICVVNIRNKWPSSKGMLRCVAVCCRVLRCVAVRCSVLQCVAVCCGVLRCVAVCCGVLRCVAVCCSVLPQPQLGAADSSFFLS